MKNSGSYHEYLIIGAGPAGLQLAYFFEKAGRDYRVLEAGSGASSFYKVFPRHRTLISINKVNTGFNDEEMNQRWDWNSLLNEEGHLFGDYDRTYFPKADKIVHYLKDFADKFINHLTCNFKVTRVSKTEKGFEVANDAGDVFRCRRLIVATGLFKPCTPKFPGVELADCYTNCSVNPDDYLNKRVLIVGKGNSALETADNLVETTASIHLCSPTPVKLAWATHYVGNVRAVNNNFLDTYQLKSQNVILDADIESLERKGDQIICNIRYTHAKGEKRTIPYDRVILATGFRFDDSIFEEDCRPQLRHKCKFPDMTSSWESTNVEGLFFAGTLMQSRDYRKTMSGFIHGFRYNVRALNHVLGQRFHEEEWPSEKIEISPRETALKIIDQVNRNASMFLQPGFFCDLLVEENDGSGTYIADVPMEYIRDGEMGLKGTYFTISLEYGDNSHVMDPFAIDRDPDPAKAHLIEYLHPIIRKYQNGTLVNEHHLVEDVENDYSYEKYIESVTDYLVRECSCVLT